MIKEIGTKTLYHSEGIEASDWVREPIKGLKTYDAPQMKSGLSVGQDGRGASVKGSLLYLHNNGNSLQHSAQLVGWYSTTFASANGLSVIEGEGWRRAIALYSARKLSKRSWINDKDEYLVPSVYSTTEK